MKKWLLLSVLTAFITAVPVFGQEDQEADEEKDVLEIHLFGGAAVPAGDFATFSDTIGARIGYSVGIEGGYFLTPSWVVGLHFSYYQFGVHRAGDYGDLKHRLFSPRLYVRRIFSMNSNLEPFVKAHIGMENPRLVTHTNNPSGDRFRELSYDAAVSFGLSAGVTYYTADYSGPFVEVGYHSALSKNSEKNYAGEVYKVNGTIGVLDIRFGLRILFGSDD